MGQGCVGRRRRFAPALFLLPAAAYSQSLALHAGRQAETDLEITGLVAHLPSGSVGYVSYAELRRLPQVTVQVHGDENFSQSRSARGLRVTGVPLETLARALGAPPQADLIDARCSDDYRAHYSSTYLAVHHPILGLSIEGRTPEAWAAGTHARDPGPYFITHAHFVATAHILAHAELAQVPSNIVRLDFATAAVTFGAITPRGVHAKEAAVQQGFAIAKQNCLRCHFQGETGGTKSGRSWSSLGTWAYEQPKYFAAYVHNPQAMEEHAHMPANPGYDEGTLAALTAYFRTFAAAK